MQRIIVLYIYWVAYVTYDLGCIVRSGGYSVMLMPGMALNREVTLQASMTPEMSEICFPLKLH